MKIVLRGEGRTDVGYVDFESGEFVAGPMVTLIKKLNCYKKLVEERFGGCDVYIEWILVDKEKIKQKKKEAKKYQLRGKKNTDWNQKGFFVQSKLFSELAKEKGADIGIFFVDTDKDDYEARYQSVVDGFEDAGFSDKGLSMIPNKISEAWLLCCCDTSARCSDFERLPSGDDSNPRNPKNIIASMEETRYEIAEDCDPNQLDMPSFNRFREDFSSLINLQYPSTCE